MEYISFEELNLIGVFKKFGWSLKHKTVHSGEKVLSLNLHITNDYIVTEEIPESLVLVALQTRDFDKYITAWLEIMVNKLQRATFHLRKTGN